MNELRRLVKLPRNGSRPRVIRELDDDASTIFAERGTWKVTAPPRKPQSVASPRRYAGSRVIGESHDNATVGGQFVLLGDTPAQAHERVAGLLADCERDGLDDLYIEWRPDGAPNSTFYEVRGPATWDSLYEWVQVSQGMWQVTITWPVAPVGYGHWMDVWDDFSVDSLSDYEAMATPDTSVPPVFLKFAELPEPIFVAHRGDPLVYPEASCHAYQRNLAEFGDGSFMLEADFRILSGGEAGVMHDSTVDRTTNGAGNVSTYTPATLVGLRVDTQDAFGALWSADDLRPPTGAEFFDRFGSFAPSFPEPKTAAAATKLLELIQARGLEEYVLVNAATPSYLNAFIALGMPTLLLFPDTHGMTGAQIRASGVTHTSRPSDYGLIPSYQAAGLKVMGGGDRRVNSALALSQGCVGLISDDAIWNSGRPPVRNTDAFDARRFLAGHIAHTESFPGYFVSVASGYGWAPAANTSGWVLMGFLSPLAKSKSAPYNPVTGTFPAKSATYPFGIEFDTTPLVAGATSRWGVALGATDDADFHDPLAAGVGSAISFNGDQNGVMAIARMNNGVRTSLGFIDTADITVGQVVRWRAEFLNDTQAKLSRLSTNGVPNTDSITVTDPSGKRGGYCHMGNPGANTGRWAISNVVVI